MSDDQWLEDRRQDTDAENLPACLRVSWQVYRHCYWRTFCLFFMACPRYRKIQSPSVIRSKGKMDFNSVSIRLYHDVGTYIMSTIAEHALNEKTYLLSDREESSGEINPFHKGTWHLKIKTAKIPKAAHYARTQLHCTWVLNKHAFIRAALYFCTTIFVHDLYITTINLYCPYMPLHTCTRSSRCTSANAHTRDYNVNFKYKENDNRL